MSENSITMALVDDHPIVLEGLRSLFVRYKEQYKLLCFNNGSSLLSFLENNPVDVVLLDIALPDANGVDICTTIKTRYPNILVIGLSNQAEQSTIRQMLESGASGYLLKDSPAEEILAAIEAVINGEIVFSAGVKEILSVPAAAAGQPLPSLTKREKQILQLLAQGQTTKEIADQLFLSKLTVDTYRKNLLQKYEVRNIAELLMLLTQHRMM